MSQWEFHKSQVLEGKDDVHKWWLDDEISYFRRCSNEDKKFDNLNLLILIELDLICEAYSSETPNGF